MTSTDLPDTLVGAEWLQRHLEDDGLTVFDASWHMPATGRDGYREWQREHIPGARFFDFDGVIRDPDSDLPHMLPSEEIFTRELQALGLNRDSRVVVYDSMGMFSSPRAWWMLRAMGFDRCALLDGGLPAWKEAGYPLAEAGAEPAVDAGDFVARLDAGAVADARQVLAALTDESIRVLDARPAPRFSGEADEPRAGLRRGHMPGASNLPFADVFKDGRLMPRDELRQIFAPLIEDRRATICSCGSGVTACVLAFAAQRAGFENIAVYDGSWSEWGLPGELPVVID